METGHCSFEPSLSLVIPGDDVASRMMALFEEFRLRALKTMNIRWAIIFAAVAKDGSFTRAATRLNVAQPWLSAQVQRLESEFGIRLFDRTSSGLELTSEGRELLPHANQLAAASDAFRVLARAMGEERAKAVRIGSHLPMLEVAPLAGLNDRFCERYKQYSLRAHPGSTPELLERLALGQLDFVATLWPLPENEGTLEAIDLGVAHAYLLTRRGAVPALPDMDFRGMVIATPPPQSHPLLFESLLEPLRVAGADIRTVPEVDRGAMEHLAQSRDLTVLMIGGAADDYLTDPTLVARTLPAGTVRHILVRRAGRELGRAAERYWALGEALVPLIAPTP